MSDDLNWDDVRFFLAVLEEGSLRAAATRLGVTQATVSRRLSGLEEDLGAELFVRLPTGLEITSRGDQLRDLAQEMASQVHEMRRRIAGPESGGSLTVSAPEAMFVSWLMPHIEAFAKTRPDIALELVASDQLVDLHRREADVVIRVMNDPPDTLVGRRVVRLAYAIYATSSDAQHWLGWHDRSGEAEWVAGHYQRLPVHHRTNSALLALHIARSGLGVARLACHLADSDPKLVRLPPGEAFFERWVWLLTHPGLRHDVRVRAFSDFMYQRMIGDRDLMESDATTWRR